MVSKIEKKSAQAPKPIVGAKPSAPPVHPKPKPLAKDELSTGHGSALKAKALKASGGNLKLNELQSGARRFSVAQLLAGKGNTAVGRVADSIIAPSTAGTPATQAAKQVADAYASGGAAAAAHTLSQVTANQPPEVVAQINAAARPTIDRVVADLRATSHKADGDQANQGDKQKAFDQTVADLSISLSRGASTPQGKAELDHVATAITNAVKEDGVGRFDEALGNSALGGPNYGHPFDQDVISNGDGMANADTGLAIAVMGQLNAAGKTGEANDILQNVNASMKAINNTVGPLVNEVNKHNQDLAQLVHDWAPLMSETQLAAAIEAFKGSHAEYAALEKIGGGAMHVANQLNNVPDQLKNLSNADDLDHSLEKATDKLPDLAALTETGSEELAKIQEKDALPGAEPSVLTRIGALAKSGKKKVEYLQKLGGILVNNTVGAALAAQQAGNPAAVQRALDSLQKQSAVFGLEPTKMKTLTDSLGDLTRAKSEAEVLAASKKLDESLGDVKTKGVFGDTSGVSRAFRAAGLILGVASAAGSIDKAINDPNFKNLVDAAATTIGAGQAGVAFANTFFANSARLASLGSALKTAGSIATVVTTGISIFQSAQAFGDGDTAKGLLFAAQAAGGIAILAGAAGPGAVVIIGAGLALAQLDKVRASNRFEDGHTEAFLEAAGIPHGAAHHLRNADDDGRSVGPEILAMAQKLGVDPQALFQAIGDLPPGQVLNLVETMHGVNPNGDGTFKMEDDSDALVGTRPYPGRGGNYVVPPQSIQGLINYFKLRGLDFSGLPPPPVVD